MARFHYRMQSILDVKVKLENQARQELSVAQLALNEEKEKLQELYLRKKEYEEKAKAALLGTLYMQDVSDNKQAILRMDEYIVEQKKRILIAEDKVKRARAKLAELMQDRKMHEKLKEHAFEDFLEELKHEESKEVDELTSYVYGQRRQETSK